MAGDCTILVVDDDSATRTLLSRALRMGGYTVEACPDGAEAYARLEQLAQQGRHCLMVLDYEMPRYNGAEVCEIIRGHSDSAVAQTPIIFLTGHSGESCEIECLNAGGDDFIPKPVRLPLLKARIETLLRTAAMRCLLAEQNQELAEWRASHEQDLESARRVQRAILPAAEPRIAGWEFASRYQPVIQVGGDFFDWLILPDGRLMIWIADATGHGASGALLTSFIKLLFRDAVSATHRPEEVLQRVDEALVANFHGGAFVTAACVLLDPASGQCLAAGAGHPPVVALRGERVESLLSTAPPLGLLPIMKPNAPASIETRLQPGETLILLTDGVYSAPGLQRNHLDFDDYLKRCQGWQTLSAREIIESIFKLPPGRRFEDDAAAVAIRRLHSA